MSHREEELLAQLRRAKSDEERIEVINNAMEQQERVVFDLRCSLAVEEGLMEALMRLREQVGAPPLSPKHTLRGRVAKYLGQHPGITCTELAKALATPVTTVNMCLNRNKQLFEKKADGTWTNKPDDRNQVPKVPEDHPA